jgi:hypothetical protein
VAATPPGKRSAFTTESSDPIKTQTPPPQPIAKPAVIVRPPSTEPVREPATTAPPRTIAKTQPKVARTPKPKPKPAAVGRAEPVTSRAATRSVPAESRSPASITTASQRPVTPPPAAVKPAAAATPAAGKTDQATTLTKRLGDPLPADARSGSARAETQDALDTGPSENPDKPASTSSGESPSDSRLDPETQIAMITPESRERSLGADLSKLQYDEEHLPRTFPGGWVLDIRADQLGNDRRCVLYSNKTPMFDGYENSSIKLQITTDAVVVNADSNLDASYPEQGLRVDGGTLVPFIDSLLTERSTHTRKPVQLAMSNGSSLTVSLGFWPTWPVTKTQSVSIDLSGFERAYSALKACAAAQ